MLELKFHSLAEGLYFPYSSTLFVHQNWRASETLSGLFNRELRQYILYIYIVRANFVLITRKEGGA